MSSLTESYRISSARQLLINAARRYDDALNDLRALAVSADFAAHWPEPERSEWPRLRKLAEKTFDACEESLGHAIQTIYPMLVPANHPKYPELAIETGGTTYVLNYHPDDYDPETNLIATVRHDQPLSIDPPQD